MDSNISKITLSQKQFFASGQTKNVAFRKAALKKLYKEVKKKEQEICDALYEDFKKPHYESILSETGIVLSELRLTLKKIKSWAKPKRVFPSMLNFPSTDRIYSEPYGTTLIMAPWNYPFQLALAPLIGAVAAGNTVVLKPSELTTKTSQLLSDIIQNCFEEQHVAVIQGDVAIAQQLLAERWDYIFFTGSVPVGKIVAKTAAKHLTPTTLELGGKNPCIIDDSMNLSLIARRIVWGKFLNAGQTCIAPDYLIVEAKIKFDFIKALKEEIQKAYGENPQESPDFPRIINTKNFQRLTAMLEEEEFLIGGETDADDLYIAPTVLDEPSLDSEVMKDEIFGPILPLLTYVDESDIENIISKYEKPLSLYIFSTNKPFIKRLLQKYSFGGGAVNDTVAHFANHRLPFGGVGQSGLGAYHGKMSFDTFSHKKSVLKKGNWLDIPVRYAPYKGKTKILKFFLRYF